MPLSAVVAIVAPLRRRSADDERRMEVEAAVHDDPAGRRNLISGRTMRALIAAKRASASVVGGWDVIGRLRTWELTLADRDGSRVAERPA
jgi:hypothetical protein